MCMRSHNVWLYIHKCVYCTYNHTHTQYTHMHACVYAYILNTHTCMSTNIFYTPIIIHITYIDSLIHRWIHITYTHYLIDSIHEATNSCTASILRPSFILNDGLNLIKRVHNLRDSLPFVLLKSDARPTGHWGKYTFIQACHLLVSSIPFSSTIGLKKIYSTEFWKHSQCKYGKFYDRLNIAYKYLYLYFV